MKNKYTPKIKSYSLTTSENQIALKFDSSGSVLVFNKNRLPLIQLLTGSNSIREIWDTLQIYKNNNLKLSELYLTLETLKKASALENDKISNDFNNNWLDFTFLRFSLVSSIDLRIKNKYAFYILSFFIIAVSLFSIPNTFYSIEPFNYLQINGSLSFAVPYLFLMFSLLALLKGLIKYLLIALATGKLPDISILFRGIMIDLEINESSILVLGPETKRVYQLSKIFCFLFIGATLSFFNDSDFVRQLQVTSLLMTFIWSSPYHNSELTQAISEFFSDEEFRHVLPFLKSRSLTLFSKKIQNSLNKKLLLYSSLSLVWLFLFFGFSQDIINFNYGYWYSILSSKHFLEQINVLLLATACLAISIALLFSFSETVLLNFFSFFQNVYKRLLQKYRMVVIPTYNVAEFTTFLSGLPFFAELPNEALKNLASEVSFKKYPKNTPIIVSGEIGHDAYIILSGTARVEKESESGYKQRLATLEKGSLFGEISLLEKTTRTADVISDDSVTVAVISENAFNTLISNDSTKTSILRKRISLSRFFISSNVFKDLPSETIGLFTKKGEFLNFKKGTPILKQGEEGDSFYLLLEGKVSVIRAGKEINTLSHGEFFGEISLFHNVKRTADIIPVEDSLVLKLNRSEFWDVLSENMGLTFNLELISQLRNEAN